ncbi:MAG: hypothetical protein JRD89_00805 [Deltaproteobacteria bacterium]|nr:hypothetical protein [Deltaproteobacteria bacterium]
MADDPEPDPISAKCQLRLKEPPSCWDFRGIRSWVLCKAWLEMEEKKMHFRDAIRMAWDEAKRVCRRE